MTARYELNYSKGTVKDVLVVFLLLAARSPTTPSPFLTFTIFLPSLYFILKFA